MATKKTAIRWLLALLCACAAPAFSQSDIRGGWIADVDGVRHIYIFKVRDDAFTGTHCTRCDEREDISIVRNGRGVVLTSSAAPSANDDVIESESA